MKGVIVQIDATCFKRWYTQPLRKAREERRDSVEQDGLNEIIQDELGDWEIGTRIHLHSGLNQNELFGGHPIVLR